jgi:hypothetical protein
LADGEGITSVDQATKLRLKSLKRMGQELFTVYQLRRKSR